MTGSKSSPLPLAQYHNAGTMATTATQANKTSAVPRSSEAPTQNTTGTVRTPVATPDTHRRRVRALDRSFLRDRPRVSQECDLPPVGQRVKVHGRGIAGQEVFAHQADGDGDGAAVPG
jgi:hypothetical protein